MNEECLTVKGRWTWRVECAEQTSSDYCGEEQGGCGSAVTVAAVTEASTQHSGKKGAVPGAVHPGMEGKAEKHFF